MGRRMIASGRTVRRMATAGVHTCPNGKTYDGEWKDGKMHGKGVHTCPDGNKYDGEWKDGKRHGKGVHTCPDGLKYDGEWKDGKRHGNGVHTCPEGLKYDGEWKDGTEVSRIRRVTSGETPPTKSMLLDAVNHIITEIGADHIPSQEYKTINYALLHTWKNTRN